MERRPVVASGMGTGDLIVGDSVSVSASGNSDVGDGPLVRLLSAGGGR